MSGATHLGSGLNQQLDAIMKTKDNAKMQSEMLECVIKGMSKNGEVAQDPALFELSGNGPPPRPTHTQT